MATISNMQQFRDAMQLVEGLQMDGRAIFDADGCVCTIAEWLDTNRIIVAQNRKQRTTTFNALYKSLIKGRTVVATN